MKRLHALSIVVLLAAAACGDSGTDASAPAAVAPTSTTVTTAPETIGTAEPTATTTPPPPPTTTPPPTTAGGSIATTSPPATANPQPVPGWAQLNAGGGPAARSNSVLAFDPAAATVYLHGGRSGGTNHADLWAYSLADGTWRELRPAGDAPAPRFAHTAIWDERRARLVIFSGQSGSDFLSDVWAYSPADDAWSKLADNNTGPLNRYGSCAGYDVADDRFLVSHGFTDSGRFDDTWAFSLADGQWTDVSPAGTRPVRRCLHTCAYDALTGTLALFGGQSNEAAFHDDAWVLTASGWAEAPAPGPSARKFPSSLATGGRLGVFGGIGGDGPTDDVWQFDIASLTWQAAPIDAGPAARHSAGAGSSGDLLFVFGGIGDEGALSDLWMLTVP